MVNRNSSNREHSRILRVLRHIWTDIEEGRVVGACLKLEWNVCEGRDYICSFHSGSSGVQYLKIVANRELFNK